MTGRKRDQVEAATPDSVTVSEIEPVSEAVAALVAILGPLRRPFDPVRVAERLLDALAAAPGPIEESVRREVAALGRLAGARAAYAQVAYRLARSLDVEDGEGTVAVAGASRELRSALQEIWRGVSNARSSDRLVAQLATPVLTSPPVLTAVRNDPEL